MRMAWCKLRPDHLVTKICNLIADLVVSHADGIMAHYHDASAHRHGNVGHARHSAFWISSRKKRNPSARHGGGASLIEMCLRLSPDRDPCCLVNAVALLLLTIYIPERSVPALSLHARSPRDPMLAVAAVGLIVNLVSMKLLSAGSSESINVRGPISTSSATCSDRYASSLPPSSSCTWAGPYSIRSSAHWTLHRSPHLEALESGRPYPDGRRADRNRFA